jgi:hypothetical protein
MSSYTSDHLSHFVGAKRATDEDRFNLLVDITRQGILLDGKSLRRTHKSAVSFFDIQAENGTVERHDYFAEPYFDTNLSLALRSNEFVRPDMVCFCDIPFDPVAHFRIHTSKYNRFGLAFLKSFLLQQGASPVFYVANSAPTKLELVGDGGPYDDFYSDHTVPSLFGTRSRAEFFDLLKRRLLQVVDRVGNISQRYLDSYKRGQSNPREYKRRVYQSIDLPVALFPYLFGYTKFFDASLPDDHPENFYMEREWRVLGEVHFKTADITRVMLPPAYVDRFREVIPEYRGSILELPDPVAA